MTRKKLLSLLLTLALLASLLPVAALSALAAESKDVSVSSWDALAEAAAEGGSIILDKDVEATENSPSITVPAGKTATIDLNGHVIDAKQQTENVITVKGTLTLTDSSTDKTGKITGGCGNDENEEGGNGIYVSGGTFTMEGGTISGNDDDGVEVGENGTFTMNGGTISENAFGVYVNGGTFTMSGGTICGNDIDGVDVEDGTFTMSGGTISENEEDGVYAESGTFTMNGGTISDNDDDGVEVVEDGTFTMSGGTINGNYYGVYVNGGEFTMSGGTICDNRWYGVCVKYGTFTMSGGTICDNRWYGVYVKYGTFTMSDGKISGNGDDGVEVREDGTFTMSGGTISENEFYGVSVNGGEFTMKGGTICENDCDGVYVWYSTFTMSDGKISGNGKANDGYDYAGVWVGDGTFTMRGGTISGNPYGVWVIDYGDDDETNSDKELQAIVTDDAPTTTETGFFLSGAPVFSGNAEADVYLETYVDDDEDDDENESDQSPELRSMTVSAPAGATTGAVYQTGLALRTANSGTTTAQVRTTEDGAGEDAAVLPVIHIDGALATTQITVAVSDAIPANGRVITSGLLGNGKTDSFGSAVEDCHVELNDDGEAVLLPGEGGPVKQVTVTFKPGEGAGDDYTITADVNEGIKLLAEDTFTAPAGKAFQAWKCENDGKEYEAGAVYKVTADVTFTALWKASGGDTPSVYVGSPSTYQVKTEGKAANGTVTSAPSAAAAGTTVKLTATPDAGYTLDTLSVEDASGAEVPLTKNDDGTWSFTMPAKDVTVSATFKPVGTNPFEGFKDLDPDAWYAEGVAYVLEKGYMQGLGDGIFDPDGKTTRGMAATLLWNMEGKPEPTAASTFADVEPDAWYAKAVAWAEEQGIVEGWTDAETGEKVFKPNELVTREAFATMLYRYASKLYGLGFKGLWAFRLDFPDADQISDWAYEAVCWMVMNGIMNGMDGLLNPQGYSTRAQIATMVYRYDSLPAEA